MFGIASINQQLIIGQSYNLLLFYRVEIQQLHLGWIK